MRNLECIIQTVDVNCEKRILQRNHFVKKNSHKKVKFIFEMRKISTTLFIIAKIKSQNPDSEKKIFLLKAGLMPQDDGRDSVKMLGGHVHKL